MNDQKTIVDLRARLFQTLDGLMSKEQPLEVERAHAVVEVAQTIINSAKVEVDYLRATGVGASGFIESGKGKDRPAGLPAGNTGATAVDGVTRHLLRG